MKEFLKPARLWLAVLCLASAFGLQSCLDDDDSYPYDLLIPNALVTVKPTAADAFYLQLDDETTLKPVNVSASPFGDKEVRALVNYEEVDESSGEYDRAVYINWIDSLLTKPMAVDLGEKNDEVYGTDPVEIINDRVTIAEDGYLTLRFRTIDGPSSQKHFVNLLSTNNPDNPYEVEFRHNAYGNTYGELRDGLVAFRLDNLPDTEGKTVKLTLKWKSFSGEKSATFNYCTRQSTASGSTSVAAVRNGLHLK